MAVENGEWTIRGVEWDDPKRIKSPEELISYVNQVGFLPLFANEMGYGLAVGEGHCFLTDKNGNVLEADKQMFILKANDESGALNEISANGELKIGFAAPQTGKKNHTIYLKAIPQIGDLSKFKFFSNICRLISSNLKCSYRCHQLTNRPRKTKYIRFSLI